MGDESHVRIRINITTLNKRQVAIRRPGIPSYPIMVAQRSQLWQPYFLRRGGRPNSWPPGHPYRPNAAADCAAVGLLGAGAMAGGGFANLQYVVSSTKKASTPNSKSSWVLHNPQQKTLPTTTRTKIQGTTTRLRSFPSFLILTLLFHISSIEINRSPVSQIKERLFYDVLCWILRIVPVPRGSIYDTKPNFMH